MTREAAILVTLIAYKILLVGLGLYGRRRTRDGEDFFLGGRQLGPLVAAISASASSSSAWTLLGVSGFAYAFGLASIWLFPACVSGFLFNWYVLAPRLATDSRTTGAITLTEFLSGVPGTPGRHMVSVACSVIVLFSLTAYVASQFQAAGLSFDETFNMPSEGAILLGASIVLVYTWLGGFWAVSLTDTLQGLVMALTAIILPVAALVSLGGFGPLIDGIGKIQDPAFTSPLKGLPLAAGIGFIAGILGIGLGYPGQPHVVNRFMALRDDGRALVQARRIAILWAVVVYAGMILLGLSGRVLFESIGNNEKIFFVAANRLFPPVLAGVMVAASLSAIMSTADSQLLVAASAVTHDLGLAGRDQQSMLFRSRVVVLILCVVACVAAIYLTKEIFSSVLFAWSAMGAAFGPLLIVLLMGRFLSSWGKLLTIVTGFVASVVGYSANVALGSSYKNEMGAAFERVLPFILAFVLAWALSRKGPNPDTRS